MPQEITKPTPLLKEDGSTVVGWASSNLLDYNKIDCAAPLARIKECKPGLRRYLEYRGFR